MTNFFQRLAAKMKAIEEAQREKTAAKFKEVRGNHKTRKELRDEYKKQKNRDEGQP